MLLTWSILFPPDVVAVPAEMRIKSVSTRESEVADLCDFRRKKRKLDVFIYRLIIRRKRAYYSVIQILRFGTVAPKTLRPGPINKTGGDSAFQKARRDPAKSFAAGKRLLGTDCFAKLHGDTLFETFTNKNTDFINTRFYRYRSFILVFINCSLIVRFSRYVYLIRLHTRWLLSNHDEYQRSQR